eukprot:gene30960-17151_t
MALPQAREVQNVCDADWPCQAIGVLLRRAQALCVRLTGVPRKGCHCVVPVCWRCQACVYADWRCPSKDASVTVTGVPKSMGVLWTGGPSKGFAMVQPGSYTEAADGPGYSLEATEKLSDGPDELIKQDGPTEAELARVKKSARAGLLSLLQSNSEDLSAEPPTIQEPAEVYPESSWYPGLTRMREPPSCQPVADGRASSQSGRVGSEGRQPGKRGAQRARAKRTHGRPGELAGLGPGVVRQDNRTSLEEGGREKSTISSIAEQRSTNKTPKVLRPCIEQLIWHTWTDTWSYMNISYLLTAEPDTQMSGGRTGSVLLTTSPGGHCVTRAALIERRGKYSGTAKARRPHPDIGDWWTLYDYGSAVASWDFTYKQVYPEERWRSRHSDLKKAERAERKLRLTLTRLRGQEEAQVWPGLSLVDLFFNYGAGVFDMLTLRRLEGA